LDEKINYKISNKDFETKKNEYRKSRCILTQDLAKLKEWDENTLIKRTSWVVESIKKILSFQAVEHFDI
jgi:hypothetical protein